MSSPRRTWTLDTRLALGFGVMVALVVALGITAFVSAGVIQRSVTDLFSVRLPAIDAVVEADRDLQQLLVAERSMIFAEVASPEFATFVKEWETNLKQSDDRWQAYRALATTPDEQVIVAEYEKARAEWLALSKQVVEGRRADTLEGRTLAMDLTLGQARQKFDAMREFLNRAQELNLQMAAEQDARASRTYRRAMVINVGLALVSAALGLGIWVQVGRRMSHQIREVASSLRAGADQVVSAAGEFRRRRTCSRAALPIRRPASRRRRRRWKRSAR
jgi:methyl-accepting chemotaxis protein